MAPFSGIRDIKKQDFSTPNYRRDDEKLGCRVSWNGTSLEDWFEDAEQILGKSEQYKAAVGFAREMVEKVEQTNQEKGENIKIRFTGHSLGGGLATAAALATGKEAIAFDAAGISGKTVSALDLDENNGNLVTNFNVKECFVSDYDGEMGRTTLGTVGGLGHYCIQYGKIYWLDSISRRANFIGLRDNTWFVKRAKTFLAHAWHVFTYQLENKLFLDVGDNLSDESMSMTRSRL